MLVVENLCKSFGKFAAVSSLSFTVDPGEVLGLIGPNGAGKTTTLRAITGILNFDAGKITIGGYDIQKDPIPAKLNLAYLPDSPGFFETLTVWEHIAFSAQLYQTKNFEKRAEQLLALFGLESKRNRFTGELSRGQRQALGVICAFVHSPKLFIMDEPMTALDPSRIHTLNTLIHETAKQGAAFILSSHLLTLLEQTYTKVLVMHQGKCLKYMKGTNISLEELFFQATQNASHPTA